MRRLTSWAPTPGGGREGPGTTSPAASTPGPGPLCLLTSGKASATLGSGCSRPLPPGTWVGERAEHAVRGAGPSHHTPGTHGGARSVPGGCWGLRSYSPGPRLPDLKGCAQKGPLPTGPSDANQKPTPSKKPALDAVRPLENAFPIQGKLFLDHPGGKGDHLCSSFRLPVTATH